MKINYLIIPLLLVALLTTGCLSDPGNPFGEPVDETEFLEENAQKEGVTVTQSGLQYRVLEESDGERPYEGAVVFLEYEGRLINDEVFVRTTELDYFPLTSDVLTGIYEGVRLMEVGSEYEFVIPPELGYGNNPPQGSPIRPGSVLIFDMTLDSFLQRPNQFLADNAEREDVQVTESGLQYRIIEQGDGSSPDANSVVRVNYTRTFTNGYIIDQTPPNGEQFNLQGEIPGLSEGIQLMQEGAIYELFVPAEIGYGDSPPASIPEGAILVYEVELLVNAG